MRFYKFVSNDLSMMLVSSTMLGFYIYLTWPKLPGLITIAVAIVAGSGMGSGITRIVTSIRRHQIETFLQERTNGSYRTDILTLCDQVLNLQPLFGGIVRQFTARSVDKSLELSVEKKLRQNPIPLIIITVQTRDVAMGTTQSGVYEYTTHTFHVTPDEVAIRHSYTVENRHERQPLRGKKSTAPVVSSTSDYFNGDEYRLICEAFMQTGYTIAD